MRGRLPLRVKERDGHKIFTVKVLNDDDREQEAAYKVFRNDKGLIKVESMSVLPKNRKK